MARRDTADAGAADHGETIRVDVWRSDRIASGAAMRAATGLAAGGCSNVSHTGGLTVLAHAPVRVGIDVEAVRDRRYLASLARRSMTDAEWESWREASDPVRAFVQHWTRVESYLKAIGVGIRGGLLRRAPAGWSVRDLDVGPAHVGALAVESGGAAVHVRWRTVEFGNDA